MSEPIKTKRCTNCKQFKPLSEFNKDRSQKEGFRSHCKICFQQYRKSEKGKAVNRKAQKKHRKTVKGKNTQCKAKKKYYKTAKGKAALKLAISKYRKRYPEKLEAQKTVRKAIKSGKLPRPDTLKCSCGNPAKQYHHWSYLPEHWLDVIPTCQKCHKIIHRKYA